MAVEPDLFGLCDLSLWKFVSRSTLLAESAQIVEDPSTISGIEFAGREEVSLLLLL